MKKDQMVNISHPGIANQRQIRNLYQINEPQPIFQRQFMDMYRSNGQRPFTLKPGLAKYSDMIASQFQPQHHSLVRLCHPQFEATIVGKKMLPYSSKSFYLKNINNFLKPVHPKLKRSNHKRRSWKGRKLMQKPQGKKGFRKIDQFLPKTCIKDMIKGERYRKPSLTEFPYHNRCKPHKSDFNMEFRKRYAHPPAPLNTSSLIIQGKKVGGVSTLVSLPYELPSTSLSSPKLSQSKELFEDLVKDEFGVECYGSMQGLIRFRPEENKKEVNEDEEDKDKADGNGLRNGISEEHLEIERRLDQDLSQFEIVNLDNEVGNKSILANRIDDQSSYIGELEDENFALREKSFLVKRELDEMRRKLQFLEKGQPSVEDFGDEILDCCSDNEKA